MSRRTQIAIVGHWHAGTSIIADTFIKSGMAFGNAQTGWTDECEAQCEHSELNWYGDALWHNRPDVTIYPRVPEILRNYRWEAEVNDWKHYGVKITHFLQIPCFTKLAPAFRDNWHDCVYVVPMRHPYEVVLSTISDKKWNLEMVMDSYTSAMLGYKLLQQDTEHVYPLKFPDCFINNSLEELIIQLGMKWRGSNFKILKIKSKYSAYRKSKVYKNFKKKYGDVVNGYLFL